MALAEIGCAKFTKEKKMSNGEMKFRIEGIAPLLMHADTLCDPLHPLTKEMRTYTKKRTKTDDDHLEIAKIEMRASMYHDPKIGPYLPAAVLAAATREAAKLKKLGKVFKQSFMIVEPKTPLEYDGPRDLEGLIADETFRLRASVVVQRARTMRTWPHFFPWAAEFACMFDPGALDDAQVIEAVTVAGQRMGLCDWRPLYGRFSTTVL